MYPKRVTDATRLFPERNADMPARYTKEAQELVEYIYDLNSKAKGGFVLTADLKHWAEYGIHTKDQLGDYLDECVKRECGSDDYEIHYDAPEPTWDAVSRHDMNEGW